MDKKTEGFQASQSSHAYIDEVCTCKTNHSDRVQKPFVLFQVRLRYGDSGFFADHRVLQAVSLAVSSLDKQKQNELRVG